MAKSQTRKEYGKYVKDGKTRTAYTPEEAVRLKFEGYQPVDKTAKERFGATGS